MRRRVLLPLVPLYAAVVAVRGWLFDRGFLRTKRLGHPVISVGSISTGGAGKTPVVILLAELLQKKGFEVRILTRGYRRNGIEILRVDAEGDARQFGDEPLLMARRVRGAAVWVGIDRHRAGRLAERDDVAGSRVVYLLDDGFQHRRLHRDVDVVLVTRQDVEDGLLPAGNLREPPGAVSRAGVVVVREDEAEVAGRFAGKRVWVIRRRLEFPERIFKRPVAFCGLARPDGFRAMLVEEGIQPVDFVEFRDHHAYTDEDVARVLEVGRGKGADGFLTTEKDAVKLNAAMIERLGEVGPVAAVRLRVELIDEEGRMVELLSLLGSATG